MSSDARESCRCAVRSAHLRFPCVALTRRAPPETNERADPHEMTQKLLRHVSAVDGMGVSDDARVYDSATYPCTSAHGPACPARGAVGELAHTASAEDDDLEEDEDAVVIARVVRVGEDVDVAHIMRMFEGGCLLYTSPSPRDKRQSRMPSSA